MTTPYKVTMRDRLAYRLANLALRLASKEYRAFITVTVHKGMEALVENELGQRGDWRQAEGVLKDIGQDEPAEVTIRRLRGG